MRTNTKEDRQNGLVFRKIDENGSVGLLLYTTPVPKARPRFTKNGHAYTPDKTRYYEEAIATAWRASHKGIITANISVSLMFGMPIPKSMSAKDRELAVNGKINPGSRPDIDNLIKSVCDALNEVAFWDDRQIVRLKATKVYAENPFVRIDIREMQEL